MKMYVKTKELGLVGGGVCPARPPPDPPMVHSVVITNTYWTRIQKLRPDINNGANMVKSSQKFLKRHRYVVPIFYFTT